MSKDVRPLISFGLPSETLDDVYTLSLSNLAGEIMTFNSEHLSLFCSLGSEFFLIEHLFKKNKKHCTFIFR